MLSRPGAYLLRKEKETARSAGADPRVKIPLRNPTTRNSAHDCGVKDNIVVVVVDEVAEEFRLAMA